MGRRASEAQLNLLPLMIAGACIFLVAAALGCSTPSILKVDGSSTVFPITEAIAEEFQKEHGEFRVTVGISGTGGGFKKFCNGEIDIVDASRPIKLSEAQNCTKNAIDYIELPVAFDGLTIVVNPENDWADHLTVQDLREIWQPGSAIKRWSDLRPEWPDRSLDLVGADTASGTFDYFTKATVGTEGASRSDYTASADDNVLVQAVAGQEYALGYLGFAYYAENVDKVRLVPVDPGTGPIAPSIETITDGTYRPLSRPLFIYVNSEAALRPDVEKFVRYYLSGENGAFIREVGYVSFPSHVYSLVQERFELRTTGSVFGDRGSQIDVSFEDVLGGR